jgi:predicted DNA-binding protein (MmcQ/YjbR family)
MTLENLKTYCLEKKGSTEEYPFGKDVLVIKVCGKMYALFRHNDNILKINLKCNPAYAINLRGTYPAITPGYHMNKLHWNTLAIDGSIPDQQIRKLIDHSYELVFNKLTKLQQQKIINA